MDRILAMTSLYQQGHTYEEIGDRYGVTRQRIHQLLKRCGIGFSDGGVHVRALKRQALAEQKRLLRRDQRSLEAWGISFEESRQIPALARDAYKEQKGNARTRGIAWEFDLRSWWKIWQDSGKWKLRGRGKGYCMARKGDVGAYSPENVYICTVGQNFSDSYIWKPYRARNQSTRKPGRGFAVSCYARKKGDVFALRINGRVISKHATRAEAEKAGFALKPRKV